MMKAPPRAGPYGAVLALLLTVGAASANASETFQLQGSPQIPAAQGKVTLSTTRNGNVQIKLSVKHLAPPGRIMPGSEMFVVWARGLEPGAEAQNLGALRVDKNLNGKTTAETAMSSFDLFITCERTQTVTFPTPPELLPLHHMSK